MDVPKVQYFYHAQQPSLDPKSPNFISTICTNGSVYPNKSLVTEIPNSHPTSAALSQKN